VISKKNKPFKAVFVTKGRKTGKEHAVWLRAVMYNDKIYFSRHKPDGDWFQNALKNPDVLIKFDNSTLKGKTVLVKDQLLSRKISEMKYPNEERAKESRVVLETTLHE